MSELQNLPPEVLLSVVKFLNHDDRKSLSAVNANFHSTIAPSLFKGLKVDCPLAKSRGSSLKDTLSKYGAHVVELTFNVTFYPRQKDAENNDEDTPWFWTDPAASVWARDIADVHLIHSLLQFNGLPQCKTLAVYTNGHDNFSDNDMGGEEAEWDDNDMEGTGIYFCSDPEEWEDVLSMEQEYSWRGALRDMYRDIATLSPTQDLKFLNFLPRKVSFWQEQEWSVFLARLKKLTLHTYGGESGAGADVTTLEGFEAFFNELSNVLFTHAKELECLKISALESGFLGVDSLSLDPLTMPKLQELHLGNMAVNAILIPFLRGRKLKKLVIDDCTAQTADKYFNPQPTWQDLFARIRQSITSPAEIQIIVSKTAPLTRDEAYRGHEEGYVHSETEDDHIKRLRGITHTGKVFIWPYVDLDTKYGFTFPDSDMNAKRLGEGHDILEFSILAEEIYEGGGSISVELCP
ncbi:uncharacterized protein B0J16DRAFT_375176 [Fusarium flagelliforme]|uniref:uncharacterized protein n=1 Tax=Fusarium flagelliforme TaxID=2675880 RepID=UPI001E8D3759|nr:uncharacterized protein B0J16DRAFT_375176 [Fusarium flagelliforme]KAH7174297.1 hypothetical protein B0J16DRAFT_375176 [Fusarium flagelliforme]